MKNCDSLQCRDVFTKFNENPAVEKLQTVSLSNGGPATVRTDAAVWLCQAK